MSDELSNSAKLAILKYLVAILLGGFSVFSMVAYFAFIVPLENLKPSIEKSVNDNVVPKLEKIIDKAQNSIEKNQEKLDKIYEDFVFERANLIAKSKNINEKIEDANQVLDELKGLLEESTQIRNIVQSMEAELKVLVQGARTDDATQQGLNLTSMQADIEELSAEINRVNRKVERALIERIVRSDMPGEDTPADVEGPTKLDEPIEVLPCDPLDLTEQQIELISIEQRAERTNTFSKNDKRYYKNIFSVAIRRDDGATVAEDLGDCILNAIVRVDYLLSEYWFNPARREKYDRDSNFRFSIRVWGVTSVSAEVHLKGDKPTLKKRGRFSVSDRQVTYFESENGGAIIPQ